MLVGGREFPFELSSIEKQLRAVGGIAPAFRKFGKKIFDALTHSGVPTSRSGSQVAIGEDGGAEEKNLQW